MSPCFRRNSAVTFSALARMRYRLPDPGPARQHVLIHCFFVCLLFVAVSVVFMAFSYMTV